MTTTRDRHIEALDFNSDQPNTPVRASHTEPGTPDHHMIDVTAANGVPFRVVAYAPGVDGPIPAYDNTRARVDFFDRRYPFTEHGQYIGSYFPENLLEDAPTGRGLCLAGGVSAWVLDANTMRLVELWLTGVARAL